MTPPTKKRARSAASLPDPTKEDMHNLGVSFREHVRVVIRICEGTKLNGNPCTRHALKGVGSRYCFSHAPVADKVARSAEIQLEKDAKEARKLASAGKKKGKAGGSAPKFDPRFDHTTI